MTGRERPNRLTHLRANDVQTQHAALISLSPRDEDPWVLLAAKLRALLAEAQNLESVLKVRSTAKAMEQYYRAALHSKNVAVEAEEIALRAERKAGEMLRQSKENGDRVSAANGRPEKVSHAVTLSELGITRNQSWRWQTLASVPPPAFEKYIEAAKASDAQEITRTGLLKTVRAGQKQEQEAAVAEQIRNEPRPTPEGPFRVIVLDPPWRYSARAEDDSHRARNPYPDLDLDAIKALPVAALAHVDSIVWLWCTNAFLRQAFECLDAWGFECKTVLTWVKDNMGLGDWLRGRTEHCLMAVRGKPLVTLTNQTTALEAPAGKHSAKPAEFYALVESLCPGNKLEMFARGERDEWSVWGAEAQGGCSDY